MKRDYYIHRPTNYDSNNQYGVLVAYHGSTETGWEMEIDTKLVSPPSPPKPNQPTNQLTHPSGLLHPLLPNHLPRRRRPNLGRRQLLQRHAPARPPIHIRPPSRRPQKLLRRLLQNLRYRDLQRRRLRRITSVRQRSRRSVRCFRTRSGCFLYTYYRSRVGKHMYPRPSVNAYYRFPRWSRYSRSLRWWCRCKFNSPLPLMDIIV